MIQVSGMRKGLFKRPEANSFFASWKAIDIWSHLAGGLAFYFYTIVIFDFEISLPEVKSISQFLTLVFSQESIWITFLFVLLFEFIEFTFEMANRMFNKKYQITGSYTKFISEPLPNIIQDVIMGIIGIGIGFLFIYFGLNF